MRTKHTLFNFLITIASSLIIPMLGFVKVRFFVELYGSNLNGMQLVFMQVITYLNIFELSFSLAFRQLLFKHLAPLNKQEVLKIYYGARKIFKATGTIIIGLAFVFSFIIPLFIDVQGGVSYLESAFYFFVLAIPFGISYFMMGPNLVIIADQKEYKISIWIQSIAVLRMFVMLGFIYLKLPVIYVFVLEGINVVGANFVARHIALKHYPWLKDEYHGDNDTQFKENAKYTVIQRLATVATTSTDSLIIGTFLGTVATSIYGSYAYLTDTVTRIVNSAITAPINSFGNLFNDKKRDGYSVFTEYFNLSNYLATIISISIFIAMDQFVLIWMDDSIYSLPKEASLLFAINIYYLTQRESIIITRDANGLFKYAKNNAYLLTATKIILSIILVNFIGVVGVLLATTLSYWLVDFFYNPRLVYTKLFNLNPLRYYKMITVRIVIALVIGFSFYMGWTMFSSYLNSSVLNFIIGCLVLGLSVTIVITIIYIILFESFRKLIARFYNLIFKKGALNEDNS